jgi:hypothetical protein
LECGQKIKGSYSQHTRAAASHNGDDEEIQICPSQAQGNIDDGGIEDNDRSTETDISAIESGMSTWSISNKYRRQLSPCDSMWTG